MDPDLWDDVLSEMGNFNTDFIEQKLRRVRESVLGKVPTNRDVFDPAPILEKLEGGSKVIVIDSNKDLPTNWRELIENEEVELSAQWQSVLEEREKLLDEEDLNVSTM